MAGSPKKSTSKATPKVTPSPEKGGVVIEDKAVEEKVIVEPVNEVKSEKIPSEAEEITKEKTVEEGSVKDTPLDIKGKDTPKECGSCKKKYGSPFCGSCVVYPSL